jgi:hypothetical protein
MDFGVFSMSIVNSRRICRVGAALLFGALTCTAHAANAQWASVGLYDQGAFYVDVANVTREGSVRRFWSMMDYKTPQKSEGGKTYLSTRSQMEINCQTRQARVLHLSMHTATHLGGQVVESEGILREWQAIPPSTPADRIASRVC